MLSAYTKYLLALAALSLGTSSFAPVEAADAEQREGVQSRARPAYEAAGIRAGAFMVYPQASVSGKYDDNVYATDVNETGDFITELSTAIAVNSNWSRHALNVSAGATQQVYASNTDENRLDLNFGVDGRIDVTRDTQLRGSFALRQMHEDRGDPSAPAAAAEPTEYVLLTGTASVDRRFNRVTTRVSAGYSDYNYKDSISTVGAVIDQDARDRKEYEEALRIGYDVSPDTNVYVQGTLNQRKYDLAVPVVVVSRNSTGYALVAGSEFRLSDLMQGGVFVGYQKQAYDDPLFADSSGLTYGANLEWYVTPLTTLSFDVVSAIEETTMIGASGYNSQKVGVRVDHELMRNVLLNGTFSYESDDYEGVARTDGKLRAGFGIDYLLNRNFTLSAGYEFTDNDSNLPGNNYARNIVGLTLAGKL